MAAALVLGSSLPATAQETISQPLNSAGTAYDSHVSGAIGSDGRTWIAWHSYEKGQDTIQAAAFQGSRATVPPVTLSQNSATCSPPSLTSTIGATWVVWSEQVENRWRVVGRRFYEGRWHPLVAISAADSDAIYPTSAAFPDGSVLVTWSDRREARSRIRGRLFQGERWNDPFAISSPRSDAFRPRVASLPTGQTWAFWDVYAKGHYAVRGRRILPEPGPIEQVSPSGQHCLKPVPLGASRGLFVAWLRKTDVLGGPGIISQFHTLHVGQRIDGEWVEVRAQAGSTIAAELTQGLMAQVSPAIVPTGGYLGQRTQPMLVESAAGVWLLWERKADHRGRTWQVKGDLLARPIERRQWGETRTLHSGLVDYHLLETDEPAGHQLSLLASELPRQERRLYRRVECDLTTTADFAQESWEGWFPIELPVDEEVTPRKKITAQGQPYQLYWADLHCHSGLTADAEGEPDELMVYARDRARLDIVTFTNNDFIYDVPLTQYEFALSNYFARVFTQSEFLALPGFEWTSRIPGVLGALVSDRGNWTPPYQNRSFPNHRSVIYPSSGGPLLHYPEVENDIGRLHQAVARAGGITLTQHDAFEVRDSPVDVAMELTSGWSRYIQTHPKLFHAPLDQGQRLGFVACGDTHRRAPGLSGALTAIYARELTSEAVLEALRERRCYATSGSRIFVDARANETLMGSAVVAQDGEVTLTLQVEGTRPILSATLVRDGREVKEYTGTGSSSLGAHFTDRQPSGTHWYYWRIAQTPETPDLPGNLNPAWGHLAWSSPHWVTFP